MPERSSVKHGPQGGHSGRSQRGLPDDLESAFYDYLGFPEADNRACQAIYADRLAGCEVVLDLACGRGEFLELLRERGIRGVGVDSDHGMVRRVRERGLEVVEQEALAYLEDDEPVFDGIYCAHFVEHLPPPDLLFVLSRARRRLRPGGRLIVATPNAACLHTQLVEFWRDLTHVRPYTLELLTFLLSYSGFDVADSGENPLRLLPRTPVREPAEEACRAVMAAERDVRTRLEEPGAAALPRAAAQQHVADRDPSTRAALRRARDRVTGTATLTIALRAELGKMREAITALEGRWRALQAYHSAADHDIVRLAAAMANLQDVVAGGARQLEGLFPSPEIFVMGVRRADDGDAHRR